MPKLVCGGRVGVEIRGECCGFFTRKPAMMTAFQGITKSTAEHLDAARFNRPPRPAKRHGFSPPFTPKCGDRNVIHRGTFDRMVHAPRIGLDRTVLFIRAPRLECRRCQQVWKLLRVQQGQLSFQTCVSAGAGTGFVKCSCSIKPPFATKHVLRFSDNGIIDLHGL